MLDVHSVHRMPPKRDQKLWHNQRTNTPSLGCYGCPDKIFCGGLSVEAKVFSCLDHCCGNRIDCDRVCRNNPDFSDRVREVQGFDLENIPRANVIAHPVFPSTIPMVYHGNRREGFLNSPFVALQLYQIIHKKTGVLRFRDHGEICDHFRLSRSCKIILSGTASDPPLEAWWKLSSARKSTIRELVEVGIAMVTTPNFSMFSDQPRWDDMHSMKRIGIVWNEMVSENMPCALHVNARTEADWERWSYFIAGRPEVTHISYEFGTGAGWATRVIWHAQHLVNLAQFVGRPLHLIVRGGYDVLKAVAPAFESICVVDTTAFMKAVKRQRADVSLDGQVQWLPSPTRLGEPIDQILSGNVEAIQRMVVKLVLDHR